MTHKYKVGKIVKSIKNLPGDDANLYIAARMYSHALKGWDMEITDLTESRGYNSYRCRLLNADGERYDNFIFLEEWIQPPYQSFDELDTAFSNGEINDVEYLEGMKHVAQI